jgi:cytochrome c-type biogenesis protein CcmH
MLLWLILALMTGAAALALLWPLARRREAVARGASDIAIYKDQLAEIERDRERGLIAGAEAQAATLEVSRRLIDADRAAAVPEGTQTSSLLRRRVAAAIILVAVPLISLGVYGRYGSPSLPDQPLEARLETGSGAESLDALLAKAEKILAENPDDGKGWQVVAQVYFSQKRYEESRQALANARRLLGSSAQIEGNYALAATMAARGMITADARAAFEKAHELAPDEPMVRYYLGKAKEQDGNAKGAVADWQAILALPGLPAPLAAQLRVEIARLDPNAPTIKGPSPDDIAAAGQLSRVQRAKMVENMVAGLAARLKDKGGPAEDWLKLIKAYSVLGQTEAAQAAAADARKALANSPDAVKSIDDFAKALGL